MFNMLNLVLFKNWLVTIISFMSIFIERLIDDNDYHTYNLNKIMKSVLFKITCIYKNILNINKTKCMYYCMKLMFYYVCLRISNMQTISLTN